MSIDDFDVSSANKAIGGKAYQEGVRRSSNPHPGNSDAWADWMDGWDHAITRFEHPQLARIKAKRPHNI